MTASTRPDLLTPLRDPQDCALCPLSQGVMRCHGAWFPNEPLWKAQYCVQPLRPEARP